MERWSSRLGFVLAAIGAAVGLGNIWRFSAVVGQNGGGAYLVPYAIAFFVFALPLVALEIAVGRSFRADVVTTFGSLRREFQPVGWLIVGIVIVIDSYYLVITGWTLAFLGFAVGGIETTFGAFTSSFLPVLTFVAATLVCGGVLSLGVNAGIERMATVLVPLVFLLLVGMFVFGTTRSGFPDAVGYLLTPDFSVLSEPLLWGAAFGQAFFSLSAGQGILLTYGSYLDEGTDVVGASVLVALADFSVAILAGLVIFPIVFSFGLEPTLGTELAFSTLPRAFDLMPFGRFVAAAFFGLLFFAALTSAVSMMEVGIASVVRTTERSRHSATVAVTGIVLLLGLPSALSYSAAGTSLFGTPVLDLLDETVGTLGLPVTGLLIAVAFTWVLDSGNVRETVGPTVYGITKYALPVVLGGVIGLRVLLGIDVPGWHVLRPGLARLEGIHPGASMLVLVVVLLVVGRQLVKRFPIRRRGRRR